MRGSEFDKSYLLGKPQDYPIILVSLQKCALLLNAF